MIVSNNFIVEENSSRAYKNLKIIKTNLKVIKQFYSEEGGNSKAYKNFKIFETNLNENDTIYENISQYAQTFCLNN